MNKLNPKHLLLSVLPIFAFVLLGCSQFTGIRKPLYDGVQVEPNEEAMAIYHKTNEVVGDEKAYYIRYPFSEAVREPSLAYPEEAPLLLEEGLYTIGEDLPAGRATLLGNESFFTSENNVVHVGNMLIRDEAGEVYFENLFHSDYGQLLAQVDLIDGHTLEIIGRNPEVTIFYSEELPKDRYILMDPPEVLVNLERIDTSQPLTISETGQKVQLSAGIFEVGEHFEPGHYEITSVIAPHATELYLFRENEEVRVFELFVHALDEEADVVEEVGTRPVIELQAGDKIYPSLVYALELTKINP